MISNCGHDENKKLHGGKAGDQTKTEYYLRQYYDGKWDVILRYPDKNVRKEITNIAVNAAVNDCIGYDQYQRTTYYNQLKRANWNPSAINVDCEADCSASTMANIIGAGFKTNNKKLKELNHTLTTSTMEQSLIKAGFIKIEYNDYIKSDRYLIKGDIILRRGHHVCINVSDGLLITSKTLKKGSKGVEVVALQIALNMVGYNVEIDGSFGSNTELAVKLFQKDNLLEVDGSFGPKSQAKIKNILM